MYYHGLNYFLVRLLVSPVLMGSIFLIVSAISLRHPPKKINMYYGYRTRKSMLNQDTWDVANTFSAKLMLRVALILIVAGILFNLAPFGIISVALVNVGLTIASAIILIVLTERKLNDEFDHDGFRKK